MRPESGLLRRLRVGSRRAWRSDRGLTLLLVMLVLFVFVVTPLLSSAVISSELALGFYSLLAISGVTAVVRSGPMAVVAGCASIASIALDWIAHYRNVRDLELVDVAIRAAFIAGIAAVVLMRVMRRGDVSHHRAQGAIVVYLLAGLACAHVYEIMMMLDPGAFRMVAAASPAYWHPGTFRYFSFSTLTTLGYGDILPVSPSARSLASVEAIFGQLYPTVMIARLVTLELPRRPRRGR